MHELFLETLCFKLLRIEWFTFEQNITTNNHDKHNLVPILASWTSTSMRIKCIPSYQQSSTITKYLSVLIHGLLKQKEGSYYLIHHPYYTSGHWNLIQNFAVFMNSNLLHLNPFVDILAKILRWTLYSLF